jgi:hypothetical protein
LESDRTQLEHTSPVYGVIAALVWAALATFLLYLVDVGFELLPFQPQYPLWLLKVAMAFVNALSIPLAGVLFLHIAAALAPLAGLGQVYRAWASRVATVLALVFLLLLPILGFATWRGIANVQAIVNQQVVKINRNADQIRAAIRQASTPKELQQLMVVQQGPPINDEELKIPLARLKQAKLLLVDQVQNNYIQQIPGIKSSEYRPIFNQLLRTTALAMAGSAGFASLSWNPKRKESLLKSILDVFAKSKAIIASRLNSLRPVPDDRARNSRLMQISRDKQLKAAVRNEREIKQKQLQRRKILDKFDQARERENKKKT